MNYTYELNVSSKKIKNCNEIINLLVKNKIIGNVSSNKTVILQDNKYIIENGCKITVGTKDARELENKLWKPLKEEFNLDCAYVKVTSYFNGCIYDLYRKSNCPNNK